MSQYFDNDPSLESSPKLIELYKGDFHYSFKTDNGVFAKDGIDEFSLELLKHIKNIKGSLLDLGCGYGVIGIVLFKENPGITLYQSDINEKAVILTKENCKLNKVSSQVLVSDGYASLDRLFDTVVLNPPIHAGKETVYRLYEETKRHLSPGGQFFLVIHKKHGAESHLKYLRSVFSAVEVLDKNKGLYIIRCS
jgi:16S rRNA (guanine1207-N2)-methyltransferase